ncbi:hypothetical protein D3C78_55460 [compost metagenome]
MQTGALAIKVSEHHTPAQLLNIVSLDDNPASVSVATLFLSLSLSACMLAECGVRSAECGMRIHASNPSANASANVQSRGLAFSFVFD